MEENKKMKKLLSIIFAACLAMPIFSLEVPNWIAIDDKNDKGSSTAVISVADETIGGKTYKGVVTLKGKVTTDFQYGYAGMMLNNDAGDPIAKAFVEALRKGKGVRIAVSGDGKKYDMRLETSDRPDYCFHLISLQAPKGSVKVYEIPYSKLKQYSWGAQKKFDQSKITALSFQTIGQPLSSYELKVISVELF